MEKNNSTEDYLESILILHKNKGFAIYYSDKGHIFFTDAGKAIAEKVYRKHLLIKKILMNMGVNENMAGREACVIEHAISDETYECLSAYYDSHWAVSGSNA